MSALEIIRAERDAHAFALKELRRFRDTSRRLERDEREKAALETLPHMASFRRIMVNEYDRQAKTTASVARSLKFSIELVTRRHYRRVA